MYGTHIYPENRQGGQAGLPPFTAVRHVVAPLGITIDFVSSSSGAPTP